VSDPATKALIPLVTRLTCRGEREALESVLYGARREETNVCHKSSWRPGHPRALWLSPNDIIL